MEVTWMCPVLTPRLEYLRWKHGWKGAAQFYSGYEVLDTPSDWRMPPFGTAGPKRRGLGEAKAVLRRIKRGKPVSCKLVCWALDRWRVSIEDRMRLLAYDYY